MTNMIELLRLIEANPAVTREQMPPHLRSYIPICAQMGFINTTMWDVTLAARGRAALHEASNPGLDAKSSERTVESLPKKTVSNEGKKINARMLEKIQKDSDDGSRKCHGWTCKQWAVFLNCSTASVVATQAWKGLREQRAMMKLERTRDRRRAAKGSDQRQAAGQD